MANDGGLIATLAQWMVDVLASLEHESKSVFKTTALWKHQVAATKAGIEAFPRYAPFAFVGRQDIDTAREGGKDLRQIPGFSILIGVVSKEDGVAHWGNDTNLGTSKIRDLIIPLFDKKRPDDAEIKCDEFYYAGEYEVVDLPKIHCIQMNFEVSQLT